MEEKILREQITSTGVELLQDGLVARTWGNVSARLDEKRFLISPSGLDYKQTKPEDLALYNMEDDTWEGPRKPSSEKGVHGAAYAIFKDVNFVIHTHQAYASAISVAGFDKLDITDEEKDFLGGIALADYGLPGTGKLKKAVKSAFEKGAKTILMKHHGAVICGASKEEAYAKALKLEEICKRNCKGLVEGEAAALTLANQGKEIYACLDDMAQMIGKKVPLVSKEKMEEALNSKNAVLVKGIGAEVNGMDEDDTKALEILVEKAAITQVHANALGVNGKLSSLDCLIMNFVYKQKYSKMKEK
ncbi:MAG: class II aldolase/adducin family protein [Clostridia bacterium]|nr:class II aldolase/adducin family protein [Clostridia bacterium]